MNRWRSQISSAPAAVPAPKATPTYPELCYHSLADLDILNSRQKIP